MTLDNIHKQLIDSLKTGVMLLDCDLRLRYINMEAEQLLAISDSKANNQFIGELLLGADEEIREIRMAMDKGISVTRRMAELHLKHGAPSWSTIPSIRQAGGEVSALLELNSLEHAQRINQEEILSGARATTQECSRLSTRDKESSRWHSRRSAAGQ